MTIPPPIPATYLTGVPQLPDDVVAALDGRRKPHKYSKIRRHLDSTKQAVRDARSRYERENNLLIEPEPPTVPQRLPSPEEHRS